MCLVGLLALVAGPRAHSSVAAMYFPLEPFELALQADVIVDGTIIEVDAAREESAPDRAVFVLQINEVVAGEVQDGVLRVFQFQNWTCASRYAPYENQQRAMFHLVRAIDAKGQPISGSPLLVLGAGNEGECPIVDHAVLHLASRWKMPHEHHRAFGHRFYGVVSSKADYTTAIVGLRECYRWDRDPKEPRYFKPEGLHQLVPDHHLVAIETSSDVAKRLVERVRDYLTRRKVPVVDGE